MTEFISKNHGHSCYEVHIKTTEEAHYKAAVEFARRLVDHKEPVTGNNVGGKWIPVTLGFLPEKGGEYLCRCIVGDYDDMPFYMVLRYYAVDKHPHFQHEQTGGMKVTHWMPLPEPPEVEKTDG